MQIGDAVEFNGSKHYVVRPDLSAPPNDPAWWVAKNSTGLGYAAVYEKFLKPWPTATPPAHPPTPQAGDTVTWCHSSHYNAIRPLFGTIGMVTGDDYIVIKSHPSLPDFWMLAEPSNPTILVGYGHTNECMPRAKFFSGRTGVVAPTKVLVAPGSWQLPDIDVVPVKPLTASIEECKCDIRDLMSQGHDPKCPHKRK